MQICPAALRGLPDPLSRPILTRYRQAFAIRRGGTWQQQSRLRPMDAAPRSWCWCWCWSAASSLYAVGTLGRGLRAPRRRRRFDLRLSRHLLRRCRPRLLPTSQRALRLRGVWASRRQLPRRRAVAARSVAAGVRAATRAFPAARRVGSRQGARAEHGGRGTTDRGGEYRDGTPEMPAYLPCSSEARIAAVASCQDSENSVDFHEVSQGACFWPNLRD